MLTTFANPRTLYLLSGFTLCLLIGTVLACAFDDRNTNRPIAAGDAKLTECRTIKPTKEKIDCIADALDATASRIHHRGPGYQTIKRKLRATAKSLRKTSSKKQARSILSQTASFLRKAWLNGKLYAGPKQVAKDHFGRFSKFVGRAKSVLRS